MIVFPSKLFDKGNNFSTHNQGTINLGFFGSVDEKKYFVKYFKRSVNLESKF